MNNKKKHVFTQRDWLHVHGPRLQCEVQVHGWRPCVDLGLNTTSKKKKVKEKLHSKLCIQDSQQVICLFFLFVFH